MICFCERCKKTHDDGELCPYIKLQLKKNPSLLAEASNFVNVAGQSHLITSQSLDIVAQKVNSVIGSNLCFEGGHQFARDIQVFKRLNEEAFCRVEYFRTPELAKYYLENATKNQHNNLMRKIVGSQQEVDWLRGKQGEIRSLIEKSTLFNGNAAGVDGEIVSHLSGKEITRVTIKAASTKSGINQASKGIINALKKGTLLPNETVYATEGTKARLLDKLTKEIAHANSIGDTKTVNTLTEAANNLKIIEHGSVGGAAESAERLVRKIGDGKAFTYIPVEDAFKKAAQGAVIGAAVGLSISGVANYMHYRNGKITIKEAFTNAGEDAAKSTIMGGAMGAITLFLPAGGVGIVASFAIGTYLNASLTNVLDEIFGKGAYREILIASGCVMGTSMNLLQSMQAFDEDRKAIKKAMQRIEKVQHQTDLELQKMDKILEGL